MGDGGASSSSSAFLSRTHCVNASSARTHVSDTAAFALVDAPPAPADTEAETAVHESGAVPEQYSLQIGIRAHEWRRILAGRRQWRKKRRQRRRRILDAIVVGISIVAAEGRESFVRSRRGTSSTVAIVVPRLFL